MLGSDEDKTLNVWPCFTDLMLGIVMILVLFIFGEVVTSFEDVSLKVIQYHQETVRSCVMDDRLLRARIDTVIVDATLQKFILGESVLFDLGRADIKPLGRSVLRALGSKVWADSMRCLYERILVEGHTDTVPLIPGGPFRSNWELSAQRAINVSKFLIHEVGVDPGRLLPMGLSKYHPIASNASLEGRAQNRRIELVLVYSRLLGKSGS